MRDHQLRGRVPDDISRRSADDHRFPGLLSRLSRICILQSSGKRQRQPGKRADSMLRYRPDVAIAAVDAKPFYTTPGQGLKQAKECAEIPKHKVACATNGEGIIEFGHITGQKHQIDAFPTPDESWARLTTAEPLDSKTADRLLVAQGVDLVQPTYLR
jgi:type I site-specific restriction endonuclease